MFHNILNVKKEEPKKKESVKSESKLKAFIKRSSEPLLNMQPMQQANKVCTKIVYVLLQSLIFALQPPPQQHQTLIIEEFEPDVFRQLIEYIHTGCVTLQPRTLLGKY